MLATMVAACGLDFGTSNTAVAAFQHGQLVTHSEPSLLYFSEPSGGSHQMLVGTAARERYVSSGLRGRYIRSIKALLADHAFESTDVYGRRYRVEQLVASILRHFKEHADRLAGGDVELAVLGRPVVFSTDRSADELAESRLRAAAAAAGFRYVSVLPEPVAAARTYAAGSSAEALVLVADFGGGTCDFCLFRLRPGQPLDRDRDVFGTAGVRVGGTDFDARIMWEKVPPTWAGVPATSRGASSWRCRCRCSIRCAVGRTSASFARRVPWRSCVPSVVALSHASAWIGCTAW